MPKEKLRPTTDVESLLFEISQHGDARLEFLEQILNDMREGLRRRAIETTSRRAELPSNLENQYPKMLEALEGHGQLILANPSIQIPSWSDIKDNLLPNILDGASHFQEPTLLLVPPTTTRSKIAALDSRRPNGQLAIHHYQLDNIHLWKGGNSNVDQHYAATDLLQGAQSTEDDDKLEMNQQHRWFPAQWQVRVVEGAEKAPFEPGMIYFDKRLQNTNLVVTNKWLTLLHKLRMTAMKGADEYLIFQMLARLQGKKVDEDCFTVLNATNARTASPLLAIGCRDHGQICLDKVDVHDFSERLRLRGSLILNVKKPL